MRYYPVCLDLTGKTVLVVGGGAVALQKIASLIDTVAVITVVSPEALPEIHRWKSSGRLTWHERHFAVPDLDHVTLVIAATDDSRTQQEIAVACRDRQIWVNMVNHPSDGNFVVPAVLQRGPLQVAVSTGGASPRLAMLLREKVQTLIGEEHVQLAEMLQRHRNGILTLPRTRRDQFWNQVISDSFLTLVRQDGPARAEQQLKELIYGDVAI